ncbi:DEAD/DEAH box helicase family protein [Marinobacter sp. 71-i]|uniref:DEAD/DEAH box helicase family protein n=1 Tax=Marinobacter iranensis TaxID=2962607 RepID=A0ABT5YB98_9GAMM|nr:DEAD/DEAH box helicase family protein [Marinobacter iranensis]MDF0750821.1 DEAD/DEAH box helicase family protein [Marinobacter iranensis]
MIQLRKWQVECIEKALSVFQSQSHFLCHATPGAGKTVMVASVAKALFQHDKIDFVVCFSPSRAVAHGVALTFSQILGRSFNGQIGAAGGSYTYQSMDTLPDELWQVLREHRVLVVLDEIHHCSGIVWDNSPIGNRWGRTIIDKVQGKASYTMALSGTPWRTDDSPIVLSQYTKSTGQISCDYEYGLGKAVSDGVCRAPKIVLTDNREISLSSADFGLKTFASISDSLKNEHITYTDFLFRDAVIDQVLSEASARLTSIRKHAPLAGGLVVAASVAHAEQIARRLAMAGEHPIIVTYQTPDAQRIISNFKTSSDRWIISVGMISEGTDIPRLQVCCHLSRIRTELHFRQVLGRILRRQPTDPADTSAWLYVLAEPNLAEFARRIGEDLPGEKVVSFVPDSETRGTQKSKAMKFYQDDNFAFTLDLDGQTSVDGSGRSREPPDEEQIDLRISNHYWNEVLALFANST